MVCFKDYVPVMVMVSLEFVYAGVALFTKAAFVKGLNPRVFVVYRQAIATMIMAPIAFLSRRKSSSKSSLGLRAFSWIFLASVIGITANQNAYFEGINLTSSTAASAMTNLIPAITFVMANILGLEKVNMRSIRSIAKIMGTLLCVTGAICMAIVKGPKLLNAELLPLTSLFNSQEGQNWLIGCLLLFGSSCFWSSWMILQVPISASCPDHLYSSSWMGFLATIETAIIAIFSENNLGAWKLNSYLEIGCCLFSGAGLAVSFFGQAWSISQRGPLFSAMFNPLCTVIVTIFAALFLHEKTYLGSFMGGLTVIIGLYVVLWGKAKDFEESKKEESTIVNVIIDESLEKKDSNVDLEEPFISHK